MGKNRNYWIENTSGHEHLGQCLWCPIPETGSAAGWLYPDEMEKGDYVIHHFTGSKEYSKGFIGKSKIKSIKKITRKEKLKKELKDLGAWYDKLKTDYESHYNKYSQFYLVYLEDFEKFPNNIDTKAAYKQIGNLSDFEKKVFVGKKGKKEGEICQIYLRKVNKRFYNSIVRFGDGSISPTSNNPLKNIDKKVESLNQMEKKKQVILYGPPGTGKTYITKNIAVTLMGEENGT